MGATVLSDRPRLAALDGIRGLAIAMVVLFHFTNTTSTNSVAKAITRVTGAGWLGVEMFFLLSAFLITSQLAKRLSARDYAERRVRRIVPMYAVCIVVFFVLSPIAIALFRNANIDNALVQTIPRPGGVEGIQWTFLVFGQNFAMFGRNGLVSALAVTWSLAVEVQFYIAWFVLMRRRETFVRRFAAGAIVFGAVWRLALTLNGLSVARIYVLPLSHIDLFAWGTLLALWHRSGTEVAWLRSKATIAIGAAVFATWLVLVDRPAGQSGFTPGQLSLGITIAGVGIAACVHRVLTTGGVLDRALRWRVLTGLGAISYSLYLLHTTVEYVFRRLIFTHTALGPFINDHELVGQLLIFVMVGAASIALAYLTYRYIETPFMKRRIRRPEAALPPVQPVVP